MRKTVAWPIIGILTLISLGLGVSIAYSTLKNNYYEGIKNCSTFVRCKNAVGWTSDYEKMKGQNVNSCHELEIVLNGKGEVAQEEP